MERPFEGSAYQITPYTLSPLRAADPNATSGSLFFEYTPDRDTFVSLDGLLEFDLSVSTSQSVVSLGSARLVPFAASRYVLTETLQVYNRRFTAGSNIAATAQAVTRALARDKNTVNTLYGLEQHVGLDKSYEGLNFFANDASVGAIGGNSNVNPRTQDQFVATGTTTFRGYHPVTVSAAKIGFVPSTSVRYDITYTTPPASEVLGQRGGLNATDFTIGVPTNFRLTLWTQKPIRPPLYLNPFATSPTHLKLFYPSFQTEARNYTRVANGDSFSLQYQARPDTAMVVVYQVQQTGNGDDNIIQGRVFGGTSLSLLQIEIYGKNFPTQPLRDTDLAKRFVYSHALKTMTGCSTPESFQTFSSMPFDLFLCKPATGTPSGTIQVNFTPSNTNTTGLVVGVGTVTRMFVTSGTIAAWTVKYVAGQQVGLIVSDP